MQDGNVPTIMNPNGSARRGWGVRAHQRKSDSLHEIHTLAGLVTPTSTSASEAGSDGGPEPVKKARLEDDLNNNQIEDDEEEVEVDVDDNEEIDVEELDDEENDSISEEEEEEDLRKKGSSSDPEENLPTPPSSVDSPSEEACNLSTK